MSKYPSWETISDDVWRIIPELLLAQCDCGQSAIRILPDGSVDLWRTFSGDNSFIPGDDFIEIGYLDSREYSSPESLGLDVDGDPFDSEDKARFFYDLEQQYDQQSAQVISE